MKVTRLSLAVLVLAATFLGGCTQFTRQNYEMIQRGDSSDRVKDVLGKPAQHGSVWLYVHHKPYYQAKIYFENGQVARKEWLEEEVGWVQAEE